jgi:hypothetical protein
MCLRWAGRDATPARPSRERSSCPPRSRSGRCCAGGATPRVTDADTLRISRIWVACAHARARGDRNGEPEAFDRRRLHLPPRRRAPAEPTRALTLRPLHDGEGLGRHERLHQEQRPRHAGLHPRPLDALTGSVVVKPGAQRCKLRHADDSSSCLELQLSRAEHEGSPCRWPRGFSERQTPAIRDALAAINYAKLVGFLSM